MQPLRYSFFFFVITLLLLSFYLFVCFVLIVNSSPSFAPTPFFLFSLCISLRLLNIGQVLLLRF